MGGAVAVPGGDAARQDALNCASVKVLGVKPNLFSLLDELEAFHLLLCGPIDVDRGGCSLCCFLK